MTDTTISLRIDQNLRDKMRRMDHINWSAILRKALIHELSKIDEVNKDGLPISMGDIWQFTTYRTASFIVDDFELYNNDSELKNVSMLINTEKL